MKDKCSICSFSNKKMLVSRHFLLETSRLEQDLFYFLSVTNYRIRDFSGGFPTLIDNSIIRDKKNCYWLTMMFSTAMTSPTSTWPSPFTSAAFSLKFSGALPTM